MIYSKKYGRTFKSRSELQRYAWRGYRTRPVFSWIGLRDSLYSDEWRKEHGLKTREELEKKRAPVMLVLGAVNVVLGVGLLGSGNLIAGLLLVVFGVIIWVAGTRGKYG